MTGIRLEINADPIPLQRARVAKHCFYDAQFIAKKNFAIEVLSKISREKPIETPISIDLIFDIKLPKSWSNKKKAKYLGQPHTQTPDIDNLVKFVFDALNKILYLDDSQIYHVQARKKWGEVGKTILEITNDDI